jgi:UTP--glucose-1-phosphate uridylyltransferase
MVLEEKGKHDLLKQVRAISDMVDIHYIRQKEPLGLGHAIHRAKSFIGNEPFAVMLGDDIVYNDNEPCLKQMMDIYEKEEASVLGVQTVAWDDVSKYGIVDGKKLGNRLYSVNSMVEKPERADAPSNVAVLGRYIINPEIFDILENTKPGKGGEIQLTDALKDLASKQKMVAYDFKGIRYDVGNKLGFLKATVEFALRRDDLKDDFKAYLNSLK